MGPSISGADQGWTTEWTFGGGAGDTSSFFTQSGITQEGDMALEMASSGAIERGFPSISSGILRIDTHVRPDKVTVDINDSTASVIKVYAANHNDAWAFRWHYPFAWPEVGGNTFPRFYVVDGPGKNLMFTDVPVAADQWYKVSAVLDFDTRKWELLVDDVKFDAVGQLGHELGWWNSPSSLDKLRITSSVFGKNWVDAVTIWHDGDLLASTGFNSDEGYELGETIIGRPPREIPGPSTGGTMINIDETTTMPTSAWKVPPLPDHPSDNLWDQRVESGDFFLNANLAQAYPGEIAPELTMTVNSQTDLEGGGAYHVYVQFAGVTAWDPSATGVRAALSDGPLANYNEHSSVLIDAEGSWELYEAHVGEVTSFGDIVVRLGQFGNQRSMPDSVVFQLAYLLGDYDRNGMVDAADYVAWRNTLGVDVLKGTGADGDGSGTIDQGDYDVWKMNFGKTVEGGNSSGAPIPEPATSIMLLVGMLVTFSVVQWSQSPI